MKARPSINSIVTSLGRWYVSAMNALCKRASILLAIVGLTWVQSAPLFSAETNTSATPKSFLPLDLKNLLTQADEFTLLSLNPTPDFEHKATKTFHNHAILGQTKIKNGAPRDKLVTALADGIGAKELNIPGVINIPADCFNPRHGIHAKQNDEAVDFLICFECGQIQANSNRGTNWSFLTTCKPAAAFNRALRNAGVRLPKN